MALVMTKQRGAAPYNVFEAKSRHDADLLVFKTESRLDAMYNDEYWKPTTSESESTAIIAWVPDRGPADLLIFYVASRVDAGWRYDHPLKGKLAAHN